MECGAREPAMDQSHLEMTIKAEVKEEGPSVAHDEIEIDVNRIKQEPGLVQLVKSEPAFLVHEEILEKNRPGTGEQRGVPATSTCAIVRGTTCVAADSVGQDRSLRVKDELEDTNLYVGPTVLQHVDSHYRTKQVSPCSIMPMSSESCLKPPSVPPRDTLEQMSKKPTAWEPASGEAVPGKLQGYVEDDTDEVLEEPKSELEDVDVEPVETDENWCVPSPPADFGAPGADGLYAGPDSEFIYIAVTDSMSPLPQLISPAAVPAATPDIHHGRRFASITPSPFSPRPGTSRDSKRRACLVDEDAFRSRSPLPGPSRESLPWETQEEENEDVVYREHYLEEEAPMMQDEGGSRLREVSDGMPIEMDVVDFTPRLSESVAPRCPVQRGLRSRGVRARDATSLKGRRTVTVPRSDECGWRLGDRIIEAYVTDEDVPSRLRELMDDVHVRNVMRDRQARKRVFREHDDDSYSEYVSDEQDLFGGDSTALNFDWSSMETYQSSAEEFVPETTGPVRNVTDPYDAFRVYWDDDIMQHIVVETNRCAAKISSRCSLFASEWMDTNVDEIMMLFAFWMGLGIHKMPTIYSCFSESSAFKTDMFTHLFTAQRYFILNRVLSFIDKSTRPPQSSKLFKIDPVIDHLKAAFMNAYMPGRDISIDTSWTGKVVIKTDRFHIKIFELCESATGYIWDFNMYMGKYTLGAPSSTLPNSTKAVLDLVPPLLNKGHRLFMNDWFNSPILARYLKRNRTDCVGMLRKSRKNVPPLIQCAILPRGHFIARHAGDVVVMANRDTDTVFTISTCHGVDLVQFSAQPGSPSHYKPAAIADYNKNIRQKLDKKDQMLEPYILDQSIYRNWFRMLFRRLLNVSILNSCILVRQSSSDKFQQLAFRVELIDGIVRRHSSQVPQPLRQQPQVSNNIPGLSDDRLVNVGQHFLVRSHGGDEPLTAGNRTSKNRGLCEWCKVREQRYTKTVYMCDSCGVYLCLNECFKNYHTLL